MGLFSGFSSSKPKPKDVAKDRLRLILIHDRGHMPPETLEKIRTEILEVISKYVDIQAEDVEITVSNETAEEGTRNSSLVANIPIKNIKTES
ncbi:MAG: cell division topological specificity factor MinE [Clostridium sp.]